MGHPQKDYTTDPRHMVLLHGYQLQGVFVCVRACMCVCMYVCVCAHAYYVCVYSVQYLYDCDSVYVCA